MSELLIRNRHRANRSPWDGEIVHSTRDLEILLSRTRNGFQQAESPRTLCLLVGEPTEPHTARDLLRAHDDGGVESFADPAGHFVAVLLDKASAEFTVLRDRAGFRHAYYSARARDFAFSTDLSWLVRCGGFPQGGDQISSEALALYVSFQYIPAPYTPFSGMRQLGPGEVLTRSPDGHVRIEETRSLASNTAAEDDLDGHASGIVDLLTASLIRQIDANRTPAAFLSGGMDTSTNVALLVERLDVRPMVLTATFHEADHDESPHARRVARHYGLEHSEVTIVPAMLDRMPRLVRLFDSPNADRAAFAEYFLAERAREMGCTQVCTGEGGDEILGYPRTRDGEEDYRGLPTHADELADWYLERTCLARSPWRHRLLRSLTVDPGLPARHLRDVHSRHIRCTPFERLYFGQWRTWLIEGVYMKDQRVLSGFGLDPVFPFMDIDLMRYAASIAPDQKWGGLLDKTFLKTALRDILPTATLQKAKQKFALPFGEWFRGPARHYLHDILLSRDGFVRNRFDPDTVTAIVRAHLDGSSDESRLLWGLLFLEFWHRELSSVQHVERC
ncbi:asparagine synthetase B family protein [Actinomadura sp. 6N118]|uniref:asparagine synthetase B family protein n=1 Tax=Actinomadura sp. 6N118 TaxID=3375151 RepID=UPI0037A77FBA